MRTAVHENSLSAFLAIEPGLTGKRREVMLKVHGQFSGRKFTRKQLARALGWEINLVTGRVLELIDLGFLEECGTTREDGHAAALLQIAPTQKELFS